MNKIIKLVSLFVYTGEDDNIRINTVYDLLNKNNDVELITTNFNHREKRVHNQLKISKKITMLNVPKYKSSLSFRRFISHGIFAFKLYKYLKGLKHKPDIIYCIVPTVSSGYACYLYCRKNNIKLAIDVIDIWPESFVALFPLKRIMSIITFPWKLFSQKVYSSADLLFAESIEYANIAQKSNKKTRALPVYLGTNVNNYHKLISNSKLVITKPSDEIWICYAGGLGNSYDFDVILHSFTEILFENRFKIKLLFIGDGLKAESIKSFIELYKIPAIITGYLAYNDFLKYLSYCDIALNSFKQETRVVHSYKFNDYILSGLAILNNLKGETADLILKYDIGLNFDYENLLLKSQMLYLLNNPERLKEMKKNSHYVANTILNTEIIYKEMIEKIES